MKTNAYLAGVAVGLMLVAAALLYKQPETEAVAVSGSEAETAAGAVRGVPAGVKPAILPVRGPASAPGEVEEPAPIPATVKLRNNPRQAFHSPLSVLETLISVDGPQAGDGSRTRTQIVRTHFKYPLIRIEERVSATGDPLAGREMVADHVLVQLQQGATLADLQDVLSRQAGFTAYVRRAASTPGLYLVAFDGMDLRAMDRVIQSLVSEKHVVADSEPDLIVHTN
jgi:hypothetical protein